MITKIKPQRINFYPVYSVDNLADLNELKGRTSVYDIEKRIMRIVPQEDTNAKMYFALGE